MRGPVTKIEICPLCKVIGPVIRGYCKKCYTKLVHQGHLIPGSLKNIHITPLQHEYLEGSLLGDGCIYRRKPTHTPYYTFVRKREDEDYFKWAMKLIQDWQAPRSIREGAIYDSRTRRTYLNYTFRSARVKALQTYHERWYPIHQKRVPPDLVLTPLTLAVWFADDGYARTSCSPWRFALKLSTLGFIPQDTDFLRELLENFLHERFTLCKEYLKDHTIRYNITAADAGARAFFRAIDAVLPLSRKACWRNPEALFYDSEGQFLPLDMYKKRRPRP